MGAPAPTATANIQKITKRAFDRRTLHGLKFTLCIYSVNLCCPSTKRTAFAHVFSAERPVCVPYRRQPVRVTCRVGAPAPTATVNIQKITKRAFDRRTLHALKFTLCIYFINLCCPSTKRTAFAYVFFRGTPGARSLQTETCPRYL